MAHSIGTLRARALTHRHAHRRSIAARGNRCAWQSAPAGATLMDIVLNFEVASTGHFASAQRLQDGSAALQWRDDKTQAGQILLPQMLALSLAVFDGRPPQAIDARLRYRLRDDQLSLWYELVRPDRLIADSFAELVGFVRMASATSENPDPLLLGWLP